ncbi:hypothetical protein B0H19DRAFT_1085495 [Mycena capillaripes]|nr:hypothetical protein B0H19DRAFT_1085495 [Mycena capillaripes]
MSPGAFPGDALTPDFMSPFDFASFPASYSSLNALMPALVPTDYSAQPAAGISFVESTSDLNSVPSSKYSQWPTLPPVQPDSPSEASVAVDNTCVPFTSAANKKRRQRQEVDPANILESNSVQSRIHQSGAGLERKGLQSALLNVQRRPSELEQRIGGAGVKLMVALHQILC